MIWVFVYLRVAFRGLAQFGKDPARKISSEIITTFIYICNYAVSNENF